MTRTLSADQLTHYVGIRVRNPAAADRYWARCAGTAQDAAMDDETVAMIKEFLSDKLSDKDHTKVCSMLAGDVEAEDTEPPPVDPEAKPTGRLAKAGGKLPRNAIDAKIGFDQRYPGLSHIKIDNSGIQPRARAASYSADGAASFAAMFPDAQRIKLL